MSRNNYDRIAGSYDFLSRIVFLRAQVNAQVEQLKCIKAGTSILVAGGGTGWILDELTRIHNSGLLITYIEISEKMLELAKKRDYGANQVRFVHADIFEFYDYQQYDVIHTAFLFDNFEEDHASSVFQSLNKQLKVGGLWLYTDFKVDAGCGWWKKGMLYLMYAFFSKIAHVEARKLPRMEVLFANSRLQIMEEKRHYQGFIQSIIFKKPTEIPTFMENLES